MDAGCWTRDYNLAAIEAVRILRHSRAGKVRNPGAAWTAARRLGKRWGTIDDELKAERMVLVMKDAPKARDRQLEREMRGQDRRQELIDSLLASCEEAPS